MSGQPPREFDAVVERNHLALDAFMRGDPEPLGALYSHADDVTLGNPFGPFVRGFEQVLATMRRAAEHYRDGEAVTFDTVARYVSDDVGWTVEIERLRAKVGGSPNVTPVSARTTTI